MKVWRNNYFYIEKNFYILFCMGRQDVKLSKFSWVGTEIYVLYLAIGGQLDSLP